MAQTYRSLFGFRATPEPEVAFDQRTESEAVVPEVTRDGPDSPTPAPTLSNMSKLRLQAAGIVDAEVPEETSSTVQEAENPSEVSDQVQVPAAEPEVIDLGTSSDEEGPEAQEETTGSVRGSQSLIPRLEIQDTYADSDNEDPLGQMVVESQLPPVFSQGSPPAEEQQSDEAVEVLPAETDGDVIEGNNQTIFEQLKREPLEESDIGVEREFLVPVAASTPLSSPPLNLDAAFTPEPYSDGQDDQAISISRSTTRSGHVLRPAQEQVVPSSPLSSPPVEVPETMYLVDGDLPESPIVDNGDESLMEDRLPEAPEASELTAAEEADVTPVPKGTAPTTVIDLGSSSPVPEDVLDVGENRLEQTRSPNLADSQAQFELDDNLVSEVASEPQVITGKSDAAIQQERARHQSEHEQGIASELGIEPEVTATEVNFASSQEYREHQSDQELAPYLPRSITQPSLYPSLPMSPSNSQSMQDTQSQTTFEYLLPESVLPPTPQLTQIESFSQPRQRPLDENTSPQPELLEPNTSQTNVMEVEVPKPTPQTKTPSRKSLTTRLSNVPDVISAWFTPKRSTAVNEENELLREKPLTTGDTEMEQVNRHGILMKGSYPIEDFDTVHKVHANGTSTHLSYFIPLSTLNEMLNPSSQQAYGSNTVDVFAVVTASTKDPMLAKGGPRDYYTIFRVTDTSISSGADVRVEVFRPWKATLPVADVGDVILLRAFAVKSRNRQAYCLSTDASAWCVWRYQDSLAVEEKDKPVWARRRVSADGKTIHEEVKGPPVEIDDDERAHAAQLREWWLSLSGDGTRVNGQHDDDFDAVRILEPIAAKL